jgi:hypothetical protein
MVASLFGDNWEHSRLFHASVWNLTASTASWMKKAEHELLHDPDDEEQ